MMDLEDSRPPRWFGPIVLGASGLVAIVLAAIAVSVAE